MLIKSDLPKDINLIYIYLLNLFATVLSYWLYAYKSSLFQAHQRVDVIYKINLSVKTLQYIAQFAVLYFYKNYYIYLIITLIAQIAINIITAVFANKYYPDYKANGSLEKEEIKSINKRIRDLFSAKLCGTLLTSADTIVISSFLGLVALAVYQNYFLIIYAITTLVGVLFSSILAGIGNSIIKETTDKNYEDFKRLTFIISWVICICCTCFIAMMQPFIRLWVGEASSLSDIYVVLFVIYFYVCQIASTWATIKDAAGLWHIDRLRPFIGITVNVILNVILVRYIGLFGVILSTIISYLLVNMPWLLVNLFNNLYKRSKKEYLLKLFDYFIVTVLSCSLTYFIMMQFNKMSDMLLLIVGFILAMLFSNVLFFILFNKSSEFAYLKGLLKGILAGVKNDKN